ncbi:unnamed protein product [Rhodiola kirilowii]
MNFSVFHLLLLLIFSALLIDAAKSENVIFIDSPNRSFLRSHSDAQSDPMSAHEVAAAVSMLLGFAPSHEISAQSAVKLNDILAPNPFNRPRAAFLLEITGVSEHLFHSKFDASLNRKIDFAGNKASIQLPGRAEALVTSLDEPLSNDGWTDKDIVDFAFWFGGSYSSDVAEPFNGELILSLDDGAQLKLEMTKVADREFTISLLKLLHNVKKAVELRVEASNDGQSPAELLVASFNCLKGLEGKHGAEGDAHKRVEILASMSAKLFDMLLGAYKGQIVGVVLLREEPSVDLASLVEVTSTPPSARWLAEKENTVGIDPLVIARVYLVRLTLAWSTGIILLIATILGVYFLMNMPLTRDTLLYSNVKLD